MPFQRFTIGQPVRLTSRFGLSPRTAKYFRITAIMPGQGGSRQYRIRNEAEPHERVASANCLELIDEKDFS